MSTSETKYHLLNQHSDIYKARRLAKKIYNQDIKISTHKNKKFMIVDPSTNKYVHFGDVRYSDFLQHRDLNRRESYLNRSKNIKGNWKNNEYSPNNLSRNILWDAQNILI